MYNQLGQLVLSNSNQNTIDISRVSQGLYFIKVKDENGNLGSQKVMKK
ncbi:MAG: T9SS type A sorting domain-containing protein [Bacteroidetes bacterium]|nr:T9SS type A sorting domain-containing protein [Bacteroidota bacterium]